MADLPNAALARMLDVSAVQPDSTARDVDDAVAVARQHRCVAVFAMPALTAYARERLGDAPGTVLGGVVGFPSGAVTTAAKAAEARALLRLGCGELDMVIQVGLLKSGRTDAVRDDIRAVVEAADGRPVKTILECHYLTDDEIRTACELAVRAEAAFVKTGTGWAPTGATPARIRLMKSVVGNACGIKAAGGVRDRQTLLQLHALGATRFGVGVRAVREILATAGGTP